MRQQELTVVCELVDHVELVVDDPDVLLLIVRAHFDLVRPSAARQLRKKLVGIRPLVDQVAVPIQHDDAVLEAPLPSPKVLGDLTCGSDAVAVTRGIPHEIGGPVRCPGLGTFGQR